MSDDLSMREISVGFTGTRRGMSPSQSRQLAAMLRLLPVRRLHHGGARGADQEAAFSARLMFIEIVAHEPKDRTASALLARNREIVDASRVLIAAPATDVEVQRSGTWATVRYARKQGIPVVMLSRSGSRW